MKEVGIRELRQNASAILEEIKRGATIVITDRGKPIASLSPLAVDDDLANLEAVCTVQRPTRPLTPPRSIAVPPDFSSAAVIDEMRGEKLP